MLGRSPRRRRVWPTLGCRAGRGSRVAFCISFSGQIAPFRRRPPAVKRQRPSVNHQPPRGPPVPQRYWASVGESGVPALKVVRAGLSLRTLLLLFCGKDSPQGPPTAARQPPSTTNPHQPPTADCQLPPTANCHQPPTANRQQPTIAESCFCGFVSCPCLDHEAESVPMNVRFCWHYEPSFFCFLSTTLGSGAVDSVPAAARGEGTRGGGGGGAGVRTIRRRPEPGAEPPDCPAERANERPGGPQPKRGSPSPLHIRNFVLRKEIVELIKGAGRGRSIPNASAVASSRPLQQK